MLSFAFSDPTGGAGSQGAALTIAANGAHPASVITGLCARDTRGLEMFWSIDAEVIDEQARTLLEDLPVAAFHVGALSDTHSIALVAALLSDYPDIPVVLDPDLQAATEGEGAEEDLADAICELLLPQASLFMANSLEARQLTTDHETGDGVMPVPLASCAQALLDSGCGQVLITGSHEPTRQVINTLYGVHGVIRADAWERLPGSFLGAGITLSAAIASRLANGIELSEAVRSAQAYVWQALAQGTNPGMGARLPRRFAKGPA
ncbi:hydroxymethylpyrimidine/phosphomethylpyrimidine kinase [Niveibacterium umoris]|uniref:bifunctional hydroxymethylpyrimidine kinase/phosphomethylpyrimidine kinase n=1 Tax=Niveibacterium umoris TaxID=1193620 RepID=UPI0030B819F2